ncbi:MAG: hypothetical protein M1819_002698 [Sarea resinae]|nr:MAG: hypothetical protein M1819_002698 [Sarea resinae]
MATVTGKKVGPIGYGLMGMTWRPTQTPDEQAFAAMNEALARGATFWSTAEFYGSTDPTLGLQLLNRYFTAHPSAADKVVLCVKGGADIKSLEPKGSPADLRASVDNSIRLLGSVKKIDIFSPARVDKAVGIESMVETLAECVNEGKIGAIGLSEVSAATIEKAVKIHPIADVEVEFSLSTPDILTNGVAAACAKHNIPILAYSPLGRGLLTGQLESVKDIPEGDIRHWLDRFQPENFDKNIELPKAVQKIASKKGVSIPQLALAWVKHHSADVNTNTKGLPIIYPIPGATRVDRVTENTTLVPLTSEEADELAKIVETIPMSGGRYNAMVEGQLWG